MKESIFANIPKCGDGWDCFAECCHSARCAVTWGSTEERNWSVRPEAQQTPVRRGPPDRGGAPDTMLLSLCLAFAVSTAPSAAGDSMGVTVYSAWDSYAKIHSLFDRYWHGVFVKSILSEYYARYVNYECNTPLIDRAVLSATSSMNERGPENAILEGIPVAARRSRFFFLQNGRNLIQKQFVSIGWNVFHFLFDKIFFIA